MFTFAKGVGILDVFAPEVCVRLHIFRFEWELPCLTDTVSAKAP
jgi:hypothetical protein